MYKEARAPRRSIKFMVHTGIINLVVIVMMMIMIMTMIMVAAIVSSYYMAGYLNVVTDFYNSSPR